MKRLNIVWLAMGTLALFLVPLTLPKPANAQTATDCSKVTEIPQAECQALVDLYTSTNGPNWKTKTGWNTTNTPCTWYGVTCSGRQVTQLWLGNYNQLSGIIPPSLNNLPNLTILSLQDNQVSGGISTSLGNLANLTGLILSNNQLSGLLPSTLSNLTKLTTLSLNNNPSLCKPADPAFQNWLSKITHLDRAFTCVTNTPTAMATNPPAATPAVMNTPTTMVTNPPAATPDLTNCSAVTEIPQAECEALVTLYTSTNGPNWYERHKTGWLTTNTPCSWSGVWATSQLCNNSI